MQVVFKWYLGAINQSLNDYLIKPSVVLYRKEKYNLTIIRFCEFFFYPETLERND